MNVHAGQARSPQRMSSGAAMLRVLLTLLLFFVVFIPFLIAPVLALVVGYLVYLVWRSRGSRQPAPTTGPTTSASASGFGAGTS